ncbi:MAG TPA: hypothetical protein VLA82_09140, partial [Actinomycetota bacterium]|nr:hypothetical protein [Actinomycetota bacterium]
MTIGMTALLGPSQQLRHRRSPAAIPVDGLDVGREAEVDLDMDRRAYRSSEARDDAPDRTVVFLPKED